MSSAATTVLLISEQFAIYSYSFILLIGVIGNFINILVFTSVKVFRRNQCAFYLITLSISDCGLLLIALPFRITQIGFNYDTTLASVVWCKLKAMIIYTLALVSTSSTCFAAIDQYLSTNHNPRLKQLSTLKLAHRLIYGSLIIWIAYDSLFLIFFDLQSTAGCTIYNIYFARYFSFFHFIALLGIIPVLISSVFSLLAYFNVRRIVQLRMQGGRRKLDKQLTALVLAKVAFYVVTEFPSILLRIYVLNAPGSSSDTLLFAVTQLISSISYALYYANSAGTFYVYFITSSRFRRQLQYAFSRMKSCGQCCCKLQAHNQVTPGVPLERSELE